MSPTHSLSPLILRREIDGGGVVWSLHFGIRYLLLWLSQVFAGCLACLWLVLANNMSHCFSVLVPCIPRCLTCVIFCAVSGLFMLFLS
jgi:hypothetical protein